MRYQKIRILVLSILLLSLMIQIGCTSKSKYDTLQNDYQTLLTQYETLSVEHSDLRSEHSLTQNEFSKIQSELTDLQSKFDSLENNSDLLVTENNNFKLTITDLQSTLATEQADNAKLTTRTTELENSLKSANGELAKIKEVYPATLFASKTELKEWLAIDDISERQVDNAVMACQNALELQDRALKDGYIINANIALSSTSTTYYSIYCTALTQENSLYWWLVDTDNVEYMIVDIEDIKWAVGN